jgi:16S rRNA processing protein RimM
LTTSVLLGVITGAHGIRGEVKVKSFTDDPKSIGNYGPLQMADGRVIEILRLKQARNDLICTLKNVTDRNQAEALRGTELFVLREKLPDDPLLADLVGKPVTHQSSVLGTISGFQNFGAGELLELDTGLLIPLRFLDAATMVADLPDGFLDLPSKVEE